MKHRIINHCDEVAQELSAKLYITSDGESFPFVIVANHVTFYFYFKDPGKSGRHYQVQWNLDTMQADIIFRTINEVTNRFEKIRVPFKHWLICVR